MGFFDFLKSHRKKEGLEIFKTLSGRAPLFSDFGTDIYSSDVIQQVISCIINEMKKLQITHVREVGNTVSISNNFLQKLLDNPNPLMTQSEFIEKFLWLYFLNYNSFILPVFENGVPTALYPLKPSKVNFIQDPSGEIYINMYFANMYETTLRYRDVIHLKKNYSVNDFMGGDEDGKPDNDALLKTLKLNDRLLQGIAKSLDASYSVNGIIKYNTLLDDGTMEENIRKLEQQLQQNKSGFLGLDLKGEFIPITNKNLKFVDEKTLEFLDSKILRHYGVSLPILTGDYTKEQYEAFYQKTLEPLIISISQAFTKVLFSDKEKSFGNKIVCYSKDLIFMNMQQKLEMVRLLGDSGALLENEKRVIFGMKPLPELEGIRKQSLNYVDVNIANKYQVGGGEDNGQST